MKFRVLVADDKDPEGWWEDFDKPCSDAEKEAKEIIDFFNDTLRPHEQPRRILKVEVVDPSATIKDHDWKKTNIHTLIRKDGSGSYDTYRCSRCGITGKRHGLHGAVAYDYKWKAKVYARCDTAKVHLEKLRRRKPKEKPPPTGQNSTKAKRRKK